MTLDQAIETECKKERTAADHHHQLFVWLTDYRRLLKAEKSITRAERAILLEAKAEMRRLEIENNGAAATCEGMREWIKSEIKKRPVERR